MSENKKLTPKIRFKGFTEDWEQRKLPEIANISIGLVTTMTSHYMNHGVLLIRNSDIKDNKFEFDTDPIYLDEKFASENKHRQHQIGDVITVHTGDVGTSAVITENEVNSIGFATLISRPNKEIIDSHYLSTFYNTDKHKKFAVLMSTGDGRTNYNLGDFIELIVPFPKKGEQIKIARFINNIDNLITLHQRKYDKLVKIKSSLLEKMFPKNSSKIPEVRFKGFTEDWEQRKFKDFGSVSMCKRIFKDETYDTGDVPFYKIGTFGDQADAFISNEKYEYYKSKFSYPSKGDILLSASGTIGKIVEYTGEKVYFQDSNIVWLSHKDNIKNSFLKVLYPTVKWDGIEGSTIKRLYNSNFLNTEINVPKIQEQDKIGDIFSNIDNLITLHQRKLFFTNYLMLSMLSLFYQYLYSPILELYVNMFFVL